MQWRLDESECSGEACTVEPEDVEARDSRAGMYVGRPHRVEKDLAWGIE